jgi:RND superfamily putative drug exporter
MVNTQITEQAQRDVLLMEAISVPLSFLVLVWIFGGRLAAVLPVAIGAISILGSLAVLRLITLAADVSIFALNLTTALGLALAIDYTLLIVSRFRDEMAGGASRDEALVHTMVTAGHPNPVSFDSINNSLQALGRGEHGRARSHQLRMIAERRVDGSWQAWLTPGST